MFLRKLLPPLMAVLVVGAYTHCVISHAVEFQQRVAAHSSPQSPLDGQESCENESACICKGVILADVQPSLPGDTLQHLLAIDTVRLDFGAELSTAPESRAPDPPPVLCGDAMRAQLQVFLL